MKLKKIAITLLSLALSCSVFTSVSFASGWAVCYPKQVGPAWSQIRLIVTDCTVPISNLPFKTNIRNNKLIELNLDTTIKKEGTAVVLASLAWGTPVSFYVDDSKNQFYGTVKAILAE